MPLGTCDPASRGQAYNEMAQEHPAPNGTGSILIDIRYGWDGVSVRPNCNGPVTLLRTRNTSTQTAWVNTPNKKKPPLWVQIDPGTDVTITAAGQLRNLGLEFADDVRGIEAPVFEQPV